MTKNNYFYDGIVKYPYENKNEIAICQQEDTVCEPFGCIILDVDEIKRLRKKMHKTYLYCEEYIIPKEIYVFSEDMKQAIKFSIDEIYTHVTTGGYQHVAEYCDCKLFVDVMFRPCGKEYTLDKDGAKQYLDTKTWYDAREYIFVIVKPEEKFCLANCSIKKI